MHELTINFNTDKYATAVFNKCFSTLKPALRLAIYWCRADKENTATIVNSLTGEVELSIDGVNSLPYVADNVVVAM